MNTSLLLLPVPRGKKPEDPNRTPSEHPVLKWALKWAVTSPTKMALIPAANLGPFLPSKSPAKWWGSRATAPCSDFENPQKPWLTLEGEQKFKF